ncbi:MAG: hypothetical protein R3B06_28040 [Kofleriaceae bacterium]
MVESRHQPAGEGPLGPDHLAYVEAAQATAHTLYDGVRVKHRSCGIAIAETFGLATAPYQILRRGGLTGLGRCGALRAGEHVLGELLGDPDPTGAVTPALRTAIAWYGEAAGGLDLGGAADQICATLVRPLGEFTGPRRHQFCTSLAAQVAALTAEALCRFAPSLPPITAIPEDR